MGNFFFLNFQSCTFLNRLSFKLYMCILYVYSSNRDILPGVNACLSMGEKKKRQSNSLRITSLLSALFFTDREIRCLISHCGSLRGFCVTVVVVNLFHLPRVTLVCEHVQDCVANLMPADLLSSA